MGTETVLACIIAMLLTTLGMCGIFMCKGKVRFEKKESAPAYECDTTVGMTKQHLERKRIEFMKAMMLVLLGMWVLGGLCGLWMVVVVRSVEILELAQNFISYPLTAGVISYSCKSGLENCSKNKQVTSQEDSEYEEE